MSLASDIITALAAATFTTITKPTLTVHTVKAQELKVGYGWVDSGDEIAKRVTFGPTPKFERTTPFEIFVVCATEANYLLYKTEFEKFIAAKAVTNGFWDCKGFPKETWSLGRYNFVLTGIQKVIN
jgi:hypothetical protein